MSQCKFIEKKEWWWGAGIICPSEPGYVEGKGVKLDDVETRCRYVAEPNSDYCAKHEFILKNQADKPTQTILGMKEALDILEKPKRV